MTENEDLVVFVKIEDDDEPLEVTLPPEADVALLSSIVASLKDFPPNKISIVLGEDLIPPEKRVADIELKNELYFTARYEKEEESFVDEMFDREEQRKILEQIRKEQRDISYSASLEVNPEAFVPYDLIFIHCKVNGVSLTAMVDTGAQMSVLPLNLAKKCHVDWLIDPRFKTITCGVGVQKSEGRIHELKIELEGMIFPNPFVVLNGTNRFCIFGIDWLTKNRAIIDIPSRCLRIQGKTIPFQPPPSTET